jgi:DNA-binding NarL/FixJ family response regulator
VIAQANTLVGLHDAIQHLPTDIILLESKLIAGTVDAISELFQFAPKLRIIVQPVRNERINTIELYRGGVQGIIPRSISPGLLVKCVRKIMAGETWIDNQSINSMIEAYSSQTHALSSPQHQPLFSPMELGMITCIARGMHNQEIAIHLGFSEQVVKNYLRKIDFKLGVLDRKDLTLCREQH